jgi:hypothetical protein
MFLTKYQQNDQLKKDKAGRLVRMRKMGKTHKILAGKPEGTTWNTYACIGV